MTCLSKIILDIEENPEQQLLYIACKIYWVLFLTGFHTCGAVRAATHVKNMSLVKTEARLK